MEKLPTIKEIAKKLNVSVSTVSRALHDHPSIGLLTRRRVKEVARMMHYEPNEAAIQFKKGKSGTIGVILPELSEHFFSDAVSGIEDEAFKNGYNVIFGQSHNNTERECRIVDSFKKNRVDGVLVSLSKTTWQIDHFRALEKYHIPVVYFDRVPKMNDIHSVSCNLYNTSIEIINFLWKQGHRNIALLKGPMCMKSTNERMRGVLDGLGKKRVKTDASLFGVTDLSREGTWNAMKDILSQRHRPTAVIAFNDYVAFDAMEYVREFTSLKLNKDICFVSYANNPMSQYMQSLRPLASVEQFPYVQGQKATEIILRLIKQEDAHSTGENISYENVVLEGKLVVNQPPLLAAVV